ncbi:hypothetical protein KC19_6G038700 [Ceratodon purpureus]|uniref:Uncharacterized protein n=1 Tax=Ceratodon purpureus TaxID=3225 RepID=A0A8T0HEN2_CERPU|nr:hypothetical protein KC19_6G038700 [Ceratodon purpureus]
MPPPSPSHEPRAPPHRLITPRQHPPNPNPTLLTSHLISSPSHPTSPKLPISRPFQQAFPIVLWGQDNSALCCW